MKTMRTIAVLLVMGFLLCSPNLHAQDPMAVGKMYKKVLFENDKVRVMQVEFAPGEMMPMHSHPAHTVYALTSGRIEITEKDKAPAAMDVKAGDVIYMDPVSHTGKNVGKTTLKLVVTELKCGM
jgi:quercetin dioxygenase-like cupin family protein